MAKTSREIPTGKFTLVNKINANGKQQLILTYYHRGHRFRKSTGIAVNALEWDDLKQKIIGNKADVNILNHRLVVIKNQIDTKLLQNADKLTPAVIESIIKGEAVTVEEKSTTVKLIDYCYEYNRSLYDSGRQTYKTLINKESCIKIFENYLKRVLKKPDMTLSEITVGIIDDFIQYRISDRDNKSIEGINKSLVPIFRALKYASDCEMVQRAQITPIVNHYLVPKSNKHAEREKEIKYLTEKQLRMLLNFYNNCNRGRTKEFLEMFFFSFYACGIRFSDIMTLRWDQIDLENKRLTKTQYKTNVDISIPINENAEKILKNWEKKTKNKIFVFGIIPDDFDMSDEKALEMKKNSVNKTINTSLASIKDTLKLPTALTMHVARHTFAVMSINAGMDIKMLSTLMGHTSVLTTEKTYAKILQPLVKKTMEEKTKFYDSFKF